MRSRRFTALRGASTKQDRSMRTHLIYKSNLAYTHVREDNAQKVDALPRSASSSRKRYFTCFIRKLTSNALLYLRRASLLPPSDCSLDVLA